MTAPSRVTRRMGRIEKEMCIRDRDTAIAWQGGLFYNPASETARDLITDGVVELVGL